MFPCGAIPLLTICNQSLTRPLCGYSQPQHPNLSLKGVPALSTGDFFPSWDFFLLVSFIFLAFLNAHSVKKTPPFFRAEEGRHLCFNCWSDLQINLSPSPSWEHHTVRIQKYSHLPSTSSLISMTEFLLTWGLNKLQCNYITVLHSAILLYSIS